MRAPDPRKQKIIFLIMLVITLVITHFAFHYFNPQWVIFKEAETQFKDKNWDRAIVLYEESFEKGLKYPEGMLKLAEAYGKKRKFAKAITWYRSYLTIYPKNIDARKALGSALVANGEFEEAEKEYRKILQEERRQ